MMRNHDIDDAEHDPVRRRLDVEVYSMMTMMMMMLMTHMRLMMIPSDVNLMSKRNL